MPGKGKAVTSGAALEDAVAEVGQGLGLTIRRQVRVARRLWVAERHIDIVMELPDSDKSLGLECKYQGGGGSAEEKIPAIIQDIAAWPIPGLVVFGGDGSQRPHSSGAPPSCSGYRRRLPGRTRRSRPGAVTVVPVCVRQRHTEIGARIAPGGRSRTAGDSSSANSSFGGLVPSSVLPRRESSYSTLDSSVIRSCRCSSPSARNNWNGR